MVLGDRSDHDVIATQAQAVGQVVESFGRVATDDRDVVATFASGKRESGLAGILVRVR